MPLRLILIIAEEIHETNSPWYSGLDRTEGTVRAECRQQSSPVLWPPTAELSQNARSYHPY
jgi:hypothetical protein